MEPIPVSYLSHLPISLSTTSPTSLPTSPAFLLPTYLASPTDTHSSLAVNTAWQPEQLLCNEYSTGAGSFWTAEECSAPGTLPRQPSPKREIGTPGLPPSPSPTLLGLPGLGVPETETGVYVHFCSISGHLFTYIPTYLPT